MSFNALTKQQKLDLFSLIIDLNETGIKVSTGVNRFEWLAIHVFLVDHDAILDTLYVGGHEGLSFEEGYKQLSDMLVRENEY
ncbi:hypothetical protein AB832_08260 [Flavobacteriaceae bacterium (ex Bugula neritina AB1)]|jgi:hypothetical protein|nr:hypothetical protein AB832_08260 [Flavobacteriaceae bacterium (ex Bugula neritina AB1)]